MILDKTEVFAQFDTGNMLSYIEALPAQFADAWAHAQKLEIPAEFRAVQRVVICGMGGSSISGELLAELVRPVCSVPVFVNREYELPAFVKGPETLLIALSHSGNTEETLSSTRQGIERGVHVIAVTTGGKLGPMVEAAGGLVSRYSYDSSPRAAVGWLYGQLLGIFSNLGFAGDLSADMQEALGVLKRGAELFGPDSPAVQNVAKRTAAQLMGRIPVIWGAEFLAPVAYRWKTQLNENAKTPAYAERLPELNHNAVVGLMKDESVVRKMCVIQLISQEHVHQRVMIRHNVSHQLLLQEAIMTDMVTARGNSRLAQQVNLIQFGDYVSFYLAMAYEIDPTPIPTINYLKDRLAQAGEI